MAGPRTLFDKIWDSHVVDRQADGTCLIYIDRHLVHEVTSPQAFEGLRLAGRKVRRPDLTLAVADHNVPTTDRSQGIADEESRIQVETLDENARESFQFTPAGREQVNGHDVIVLDYQQVSHTPSLKSDLKGLPAPLKGAEVFYRGRLWLDAETARLRREVREVTLRLPSLSHPLVLYRFELDYADSRFGFLTPRRIVVTIYSRGRTGADKKPELLLGGKITFEYGAFSRFAVEVPDASLNPPEKP